MSLHSPSGPVSLIGGGHATAAMAGAVHLEPAVYEADWPAELVTPHDRVEGGRLWMPDGAGLGAALNEAVVGLWSGTGGIRRFKARLLKFLRSR